MSSPQGIRLAYKRRLNGETKDSSIHGNYGKKKQMVDEHIWQRFNHVKYGSIAKQCELLHLRRLELIGVVAALKQSVFSIPSYSLPSSPPLNTGGVITPAPKHVHLNEKQPQETSLIYISSDEEDIEPNHALDVEVKIDSVVCTDSNKHSPKHEDISNCQSRGNMQSNINDEKVIMDQQISNSESRWNMQSNIDDDKVIMEQEISISERRGNMQTNIDDEKVIMEQEISNSESRGNMQSNIDDEKVITEQEILNSKSRGNMQSNIDDEKVIMEQEIPNSQSRGNMQSDIDDQKVILENESIDNSYLDLGSDVSNSLLQDHIFDKVGPRDLENDIIACDGIGKENWESIKDENILLKSVVLDTCSKEADDESMSTKAKNTDEVNDYQVAFKDHNCDEELQYQALISEDHLESVSGTSDYGGLEGLWHEMSLALAYKKGPILGKKLKKNEQLILQILVLGNKLKKSDTNRCSGGTSDESAPLERKEECEHMFTLKDDVGIVCQICGIIQKGIEQIFEYQWRKGSRSTRTYPSQTQNGNRESNALLSEMETPEQHALAATIAIHPRHEKIMKFHQLEGFNFLVRNLINDDPGGCILAHAPGSGKTFMIISFIQSFLGKYPYARPLIVLPKGILLTWKGEFQKWQIENIPLYDFYSAKANNRSQQLEVLVNWRDHKSILLLGYQQLANIIRDVTYCDIAAACKKILLQVPSLLIIDEGHTPRNDDTHLLHSLASIETPRKVVLSGTLYQNHVKEVFNILNLVRPKFLKGESSRCVVRRIQSHVEISGSRRFCKGDPSSFLFELIEKTLQSDDYSRKVRVIKDLRDMTREALHYYKGDFLEELPGLVDTTLLLKLTSKQNVLIKKFKKFDRFQASCLCSAISIHPRLCSSGKGKLCSIEEKEIDSVIKKLDTSDGVKLKFFLNILSLSEAAGEKVLVFSQYLLPLRFLERLVAFKKGWRSGKESFMIYGKSSSEERECSMKQFNNSSDAKVLFGSIKACGEGISLVGASRVIILDVHLNPSVSRQAIGRAFRPGQTKKVHVYRLVAADSPEEEDHNTSFRKELTSKMWFEWSEFYDDETFTLKAVELEDCDDAFLQNCHILADVKALYKRYL